MVALVTFKNEEYLIKNKDARVVTAIFNNFSDAQRKLTPKFIMESRRNPNLSKLFYDFPCYLQEERRSIKNEGTRMVTTFFQY